MKTIMKKMLFPIAVCITIVFIFSVLHGNALAQITKTRLIPITSVDFVKPIWHPQDVIINAGNIGRYKFSIETGELKLPENIKIRPELIKLLNDLQKEFNTPMIIMSGYRSMEQDIYLWASNLSDKVNCIKELNEENHGSWEDWVGASQRCSSMFPLCSKHQTGESVDFYWKGLDFRSERKRELMVELINEISGSREYTDEERKMYGIPEGNNNLLKVTAYMQGEGVSVLNPNGNCYFHIEYQPSKTPHFPGIGMIGKRMSEHEELELFYKSGEYVLIEYDDFLYLARIVSDSDIKALKADVYIFCDQIRDKLGDKVSKNLIHARRNEPEGGWGNNKVMLEYLQDDDWVSAMDAIEYEEYYMVPSDTQDQMTVSIKNVRFPIAKIH